MGIVSTYRMGRARSTTHLRIHHHCSTQARLPSHLESYCRHLRIDLSDAGIASILLDLPVTSTTLLASFSVQKASTHLHGVLLVPTHAPMAPLRITTDPAPSGPTPMSRKRRHASSTSSLVGSVGIERSDSASSAFGLGGTPSARLSTLP